jgi:hypothetical protein
MFIHQKSNHEFFQNMNADLFLKSNNNLFMRRRYFSTDRIYFK